MPIPKTHDLRRKTRRRWKLVKGVVKFLMSFFLHRRRTKYIDAVKFVLGQLGEWTRVKHSMCNLVNNVVKIQRNFRAFMVVKRERCDLIAKEWTRIEENHLASFFKLYTELIVDEEMQKTAAKNFSYVKSKRRASMSFQQGNIFGQIQNELGLDSHKNVAGGHSLAESTVDWTPFRIPEAERSTMIGRYYMAQLRRHSRGKANILELFQNALKMKREAVNFLKFFGEDVELSQGKMEERAPTPRPQVPEKVHQYWFPSEETVLDMIALSVDQLTKANILPFRDHAARKAGLKGNTFWRGNESTLQKLWQQMFSRRGDIKATAPTELVPSPKHSKSLKNMDDVFDTFTPRYKDNNADQGDWDGDDLEEAPF